jgi:excinuclease ABC subunit C
LISNPKLPYLRDILKHQVPKEPGVYVFMDSAKRILYVGKAKILSERLRSYFYYSGPDFGKTKHLIEHIDSFTFFTTSNEHEALLLENMWIKKEKPPYNIRLKDGRGYPFFIVTMEEDWPRIIRGYKIPPKKSKNVVVGPFTMAGKFYSLQQIVHQYFPLVKCNPRELRNATRPCNYYHVGLCSAPCVDKITKQEYKEQLQLALKVLQGKPNIIVHTLQERMRNYASQMAFEKAAEVRDYIQKIQQEHLPENLLFNQKYNIDIWFVEYFAPELVTFVASLEEGNLAFSQENTDIIPMEDIDATSSNAVSANIKNTVYWSPVWEQIKSSLEQWWVHYYTKHAMPDYIFIVSSVFAPNEYIHNNSNLTPPTDIWPYINKQKQPIVWYGPAMAGLPLKILHTITGVSKKEQMRWLEFLTMIEGNFARKVGQSIEKTTSLQHSIVDLQTVLGLANPPYFIECYDISHIQGTNPIGSHVVFKNGKPDTDSYRLYNIKSLPQETYNDFEALQEVLTRRLQHIVSHTDAPDLVIIDGGAPQLDKVLPAFHAVSSQITVVGIAKSRTLSNPQDSVVTKTQERLVVPQYTTQYTGDHAKWTYTEIPLDSHTGAYRLVTQLRDEAHRFAITNHRKKRKVG